jgi:hypothetical protein
MAQVVFGGRKNNIFAHQNNFFFERLKKGRKGKKRMRKGRKKKTRKNKIKNENLRGMDYKIFFTG